MVMDQQGQISIEFVLVIALMAVIVIAVGSYVGDANEKNVISAAARSGADNATTALALLNVGTAAARVTDVNTTATGTNVTILIDISRPLSNDQIQNITNSTLSSIAALGYTRINSTNPDTNPSTDYIRTGRHIYYVQII